MKIRLLLVALVISIVSLLSGCGYNTMQANEEAVKAALGDEVKKWLAISAGFGIALATIGGAETAYTDSTANAGFHEYHLVAQVGALTQRVDRIEGWIWDKTGRKAARPCQEE